MKKRDVARRDQRRDRLLRERVHDPYKTRLKLKDPTVCPQCGAVYERARWHWGLQPKDAREELCQACHRINDNYPAGVVTLAGEFLAQHKDEIVGLVLNQEALEKGEHPLARIMAMTEREDALVITTTDIHLPRRIGKAVHDAYGDELDFHYDEEG